jgi:hypothetical protein
LTHRSGRRSRAAPTGGDKLEFDVLAAIGRTPEHR